MSMTKMNVVEHLEEVRKRFIFILVSFVLFLVLAFLFVEEIYNVIVYSAEQELTILGPSDVLWVYFMIAGSFSLVCSTPIVFYHIWRFVSPGLEKHEIKTIILYIPLILFCFLIGISFGYFILFPNVFSFLSTLAADHMNTMYTVDKYFKFLLNLTLPLGFLFEMPILIMLLTKIGIINPLQLAKTRKLAYLLLTIISTLVTPPDFISALIVMVPLFLLYEISISISKFIYKKKVKRENSLKQAS
ncbi:twin-arginine translocase subunit TatC [Metabacillus litoralis]|uniref:twin-arginine translocase subunit TatC n=1 Tax=Metabacillus litoralis TaxID=152268 RepID=UPI000EF6003C|nr:twin-arginine translocase subunit TatC [Metabacillus litoralis]